MRELKLKYVLELLSDIGAKSQRDAATMAEAQKRVQQALKETNNQVGAVERTLLRLGGVGTASAQRQADYLSRLALRYHDVRRAAEGAVGAMQKVGAVGAGVAAGGLAADRMMRAPMEYSLRLAHMANTASADRDAAGRVQGKNMLDAGVRAAVRTGGGSRDDAAAALDFLVASGTVTAEQAVRMLPMLTKASSGSGATAQEMAAIGVRSMQNFRIPVEQMPKVFAMAMAAGQAGGFELKDMAKWLPEQMAMGGNIGMSGLEGLAKLVSWNQASVLTAGSKDQAGNNLRDLLMELNTPHFKGFLAQQYLNDGQKLKPGERAGQMKSIDDIFLGYQARGVDRIGATLDIMEKVFAKDKSYVALKAKLAGTTDTDERRQILEAMVAQTQGSAVGKVFHNQQSLMAFLGLMNNRPYVDTVMGRVRNDTGAIDTAFNVVSQESEFKRRQALNEAAIASSEAMDRLAPSVNSVFDGATNLAREFPLLSAAVVGATGAFGVAAAALMGGSVAGGLLGRTVAGGAASAAGAAAAGAAAGAVADAAARARLAGNTLLMGSTPAEAAAVTGGRFMAGRMALRALPYVGLAYGAWEMFGHRSRNSLSPQEYAEQMRQLPPGPGGLGEAVFNTANGPMQHQLGDGRITVDVNVKDDRVIALPRVDVPMSVVKLTAGATNPAGYAR
jgi:hypothetical protein